MVRLPRIVLPLATFALAGSLGLFGCGRTNFDSFGADQVEGTDYAVDFAREIELDTTEIVLVELVAPALEDARTEVATLPMGVPLDEVIASVCPEGPTEVIVDTTGAVPAILVYRDDELRGVIWQ